MITRTDAIAILQKDLQNFCEAKECWESYGVEIIWMKTAFFMQPMMMPVSIQSMIMGTI